MPLATTWMDLEMIILSKVSQTEKWIIDVTYIWNLKKKKRKIYKAKTDSQTLKMYHGYQRGKVEGRINQELGTDMYTNSTQY